MTNEHKRSLFLLYLAYFADYFCWGASFTFIGAYFSSFKDLAWDPDLALGVAFGAYFIGEVIGSLILGDLSDWIGRKKVLIHGLWGSIFSMVLCTFSIGMGSFVLFLTSQVLIGFFSGKLALAQAAIVETQAGTKGQKLAFLSVLGGAAWILGPFLGGLLINGGYLWPNLLACGVYAATLLCIYLFYNDTYQTPHHGHRFAAVKFLKNIGGIFILSWKERLFFVFILNLFGWYLLVVSLSDFLVVRFHLTEAQIVFFNSYVSFWFTLGGVLGTAWLLQRWKAKNILFWTLIVGSMGIFLLFGAERMLELWTYLAIPAITEAWIHPAYQTVLSDHTSPKKQGKLFGLIGASNGICQFVASLILGGITSQFAILFAALLFLSSAVLLPAFARKKDPNTTNLWQLLWPSSRLFRQ
jgi:MFS family permease